jgi:hypothetical protein
MFDDNSHRYAPDAVLVVNGRKGLYALVQGYYSYPIGAHPPECPLIKDCVAVKLVTKHGDRWYGCHRAYINAELKMVLVGHNLRDEVRQKWAMVPQDLQDGRHG